MPYFSPTGNTTLIARRGYGRTPTGLGGVVDQIGGFVKSGASAALSVYSSGQQAAGQAAAYRDIAQQQAQAAANAASGGLPGWAVPVGLAAAGLAAVVIFTRKRSNPARRRR